MFSFPGIHPAKSAPFCRSFFSLSTFNFNPSSRDLVIERKLTSRCGCGGSAKLAVSDSISVPSIFLVGGGGGTGGLILRVIDFQVSRIVGSVRPSSDITTGLASSSSSSLLIAGKQAPQVQNRRLFERQQRQRLRGQPKEAGGDRAARAEVE